MLVLPTADEGKLLMGEEAEQTGVMTEVDTGVQIAYVEPDPDIVEIALQGLGFGDADGGDTEVPAESVETVTGSGFRVAKDL